MMDDNLAYTIAGIGRKKDPYEQRRSFAQRLAIQGMDTSPIQSPWQGAARLAQALVGAYGTYKADTDEKKATEDRNTKLAEVMAKMKTDPEGGLAEAAAIDPEFGLRAASQLAIEKAKINSQREGRGQVASGYGGMSTSPPSGGYQGTLGGYESNNNPTALNPQSGAGGQFQFIPQTWADVRAKNPDLNLPPDPRQAPPELQAEAEKRFRAGNAQALQGAGIPPTPANLYLAHRAGAQGAQTLLKADPNAPMAAVVPPAWIAQNPDMQGKTVGQFVQMAQQRFGGNAPPPGPQIAQGTADTNGMPPTPSPQGVQSPTMVAPPQIPQRMTIEDAPRAMLAPYVARYRAGDYGSDPAEAHTRMRADMQRALDVSFENQKLEYQRLQGDYEYRRKRGDDQTGADQKRTDEQRKQTIEAAGKLRDDFNNLQSVKDYNKASTVFRSAVEAAKGDTKAGDINMVYAFATLMDPGSVVRDSETGMVYATAGASDRVKGLVAGLQGKSGLSKETKAALLKEMGTRYESYKSSHDNIIKTFSGIAERSGLNKDDVIIPVEPVEWKNATAGPAQPKTKAEYDQLPPGAQYIAPDGSTRTKGGGQ